MLQENQTGKPSSDAIEKHGDAARDIRFQSLTDFSDWLETQLDLISRVGIENYQQSQIG